MSKINESMLVSQVIDMDPEVVEIFLKNGLNCSGCPGADSENLREAAESHNVDLNKLLTELNGYFSA